MQIRSFLGAVLVTAALAACSTGSGPAQGPVRSSGAVGTSLSGDKLFLADADNDELLVFDIATEAVTARVKVGRGPERAVVAPDGLVYVTNRFDRSVSVVDPVGAREIGRIAVGTEPIGLALSSDGKSIVVANSTAASLSVIDVGSRTVSRTIAVGQDPTGVALTDDGKAYVTHFRSGKVSVLDLEGGLVKSEISLALSVDETFGERRSPGLAPEVVVTPDGHALVPHTQAKDEPLPTDVGETGGNAYVSGSIPVVATAIASIDTATDLVVPTAALGDKMAGDCFDCGRPAVLGGSGAFVTSFTAPVSGPSSAVVDQRGEWLFLANEYSNNVVVRSTRTGQTLEPIRVGAGPRGLALSKDGRRAYVYNAIDHTVSILEGGDGAIRVAREIVVGRSNLTPQQELGRRLFFSATDGRMTSANTNPANGISCASCHPAGREDGRTWSFSEGKRNTPTLAGRRLAATAPYHWDGLLEDMHAFRMVVEDRMGGAGSSNRNDPSVEPLAAADFDAIMAYLDVQASPDHPMKGAPVEGAIARGKTIFEGKAACASCHAGADLTDNGFWDVRTIRSGDRFPKLVNTPTLHNISITGPYLHDGSVPTLRARLLDNPDDRHGLTSVLSTKEVDDLLAYLETL